MHLSRYLGFWTRQRPDHPALVFEDHRLNWTQLDRAAEGVASQLLRFGIQPQDRVGCLLSNGIEWCVALAAAYRIGATFVPLNPLYGDFELTQIATDAECAALVSIPDLAARLPNHGVDAGDGAAPLIYDLRGGRPPVGFQLAMESGAGAKTCARPDDDIALLCYTSGTTGIPKGVMLSHRNIELVTSAQGQAAGWTFQGRTMILSPLAFTGGVLCNLTPVFMLGATAIVEPRVDPERVLNLIESERVTYLGGVPAMWQRLAESPRFNATDISSLGICSVGGAPVPTPLAAAFLDRGVSIRNQYGTSEAAGFISMPDAQTALRRPESQGQPLPILDLEVRDEEGRSLPAGDVGEIFIRGPQMMRGYWRKPEASAQAFSAGWYQTGDLGRLEDAGDLVLVDRKKNMLITGGVNVYPAEVERALFSIPEVADAVVFGLPSERFGEEVAAIVHAPRLSPDVDLVLRLREMLGPYKAPKRIAFASEPLPRTVSNKVARQGLPELFAILTAERPREG